MGNLISLLRAFYIDMKRMQHEKTLKNHHD